MIPNRALKNSIDDWRAALDQSLREARHEVPYNRIVVGELLVSARTKRICKGSLFGRPVAVVEMIGAGRLSEAEADILSRVGKHPHVTQFIARSVTPDNRGVMVLELAPSGRNLYQVITYLADRERRLHEKVALMILYQIADGMAEIHANGILHKDLSARNILVFDFDEAAPVPERVKVKVSDFGMSTALEDTMSIYYSSSGGGNGDTRTLPVRWMAPETLLRNRWSQQSDIYSFGVLVWELLSGGDVPWGIGMSNADVQARVISGERLAGHPSWPRSLVDMMTRCFSAPADIRPSFSDLKTELIGLLKSGPFVLPGENNNEVN